MSLAQELEGSRWSIDYYASYTTKDLIQYALAVGYASDSPDDELRYTFEADQQFEAVPTFSFVLPSWACRTPTASFSCIQLFPSPLMNHAGLIPTNLIQGDIDLDNFPVIHISQSAIWHRKIPVPRTWSPGNRNSSVCTLVSSRVVAVSPKSIGTFVETATRIRLENGDRLCTMWSTFLVLGIDSSQVTAMARDVSEVTITRARWQIPHSPPTFQWSFTTQPNQALLYRMASGDSNTIHVCSSKEVASNAMSGRASGKPILHGLCTLGIALRGILRCLNHEVDVVAMHAHFTKPVLVGDTLTIDAWVQTQDLVVFRVRLKGSDTIVLDRGELVLTVATFSKSKL
jgi:acyl dehydratase